VKTPPKNTDALVRQKLGAIRYSIQSAREAHDLISDWAEWASRAPKRALYAVLGYCLGSLGAVVITSLISLHIAASLFVVLLTGILGSIIAVLAANDGSLPTKKDISRRLTSDDEEIVQLRERVKQLEHQITVNPVVAQPMPDYIGSNRRVSDLDSN
jgi:hypothetical protein